MKAPNLHLNLLRASERQSSSPVRLRVMLPILAVLACLGCLVWWGVLAGQLMLVKSQSASIEKDLAAKKAQHGGIEVNEDMLAILHQVAVVGGAVEVRHAVGDGGE